MTLKFKWETEFKETEIGEIPKDWKERFLGDVLDIKYGKSLPERERKEGNIPVFGSSGIIGYHNVAYSKAPGLIIGRKGNIGSIYLSKTDFYPIDTVFYAENVKNAEFIYYIFSSLSIEQLMSDSAVPGLNINFLKNIKIPYPSPTEQSRIATVLSWFDDLIENKKRQNEILEKVAMAIFKSWFVDFEPFKDEEFVYNEELGKEIPKGWEVKPIGEVAEFYKGISYKGSEKFYSKTGSEKELVFITLDNILRGGGFKINYTWIISERIKKHQLLRDGDLIIANTDMTQEAKVIGSPAIVTFPIDYYKEYGVYSHHITKIIPHSEIYRLFLYVFLKLTQDENTTFSTGTNVLGLDIENFKKNKFVLLPPRDFLKKFHSLVEPLFQKIILNQKQIMILRKIRDVLLPQLVFGKLRVEEV